MRKYEFSDDRTSEEIEKTIGFVIATDKFLSGWGRAPRKSVVAVPFTSEEDKEDVLRRMRRRTEMIRVREVYGKTYYPSLQNGDHLHIYDTTSSFRYPLANN
jgi:hypothetical protein